jgi:hypothetical protein
VKDKDGNNIFVIYNNSVHFYVESDTTGSRSYGAYKGGFVVSGKNSGAKANNDILVVNEDSTHIYINKKINDRSFGAYKGGFIVSGKNSGRADSTENYFTISPSDSADVINPGKPLILWYPVKEAFLTGRVLIESPDSVGTNSMATGFESKAIGDYSQALGYLPVAKGNNSTAIGNYARSEGNYSYALGNYALAQDSGSYAIGSGAKATGLRSFALGSTGLDSAGNATSSTIANGDYSYAFGMGSIANNEGSFAIGTQDTANGQYSLAMGYGCFSEKNAIAIGLGSKVKSIGGIAIGLGAKVDNNTTGIAIGNRAYSSSTQYPAVAIGKNVTATGAGAVAIGYNSEASGTCSFASGDNATASGGYSYAFGGTSEASGGRASYAFGWLNSATGNYSYSFGEKTIASGSNSYAFGEDIEASGKNTIAISLNDQDGTDVTQDNTMAILGGRVGIGVASPSYKLQLPNLSANALGKGLAYAWATYSDRRVKTDAKEIPYGINIIMKIRPLMYKHHGSTFENGKLVVDPNNYEETIGMFAQELYKVLPVAVNKPKDESKDYWSIDYIRLIPVLIKSEQEQQRVIEKQQKIINDLLKRVEKLENKN